MKNPIGFGIAVIAATASLAVAGGDEDKNKKNSSTLERLSATDPQGTAVTVKAEAGKGITIDAGDNFSFNLKNRVQFLYRFEALEIAPDTSGFSIPRARTAMGGHLYNKDFRYFLQMEWSTATSNLRDAWFRWNFWKNDQNSEVAFRVGAGKPMHGREATGSSGLLEFVDRSVVSRTFSNSRVLHAMLMGSHVEGKKFNWNVGILNSDPAGGSNLIAETGNNALNADNELNFIFGLRFDPMGDMGDEQYMQGDLRPADKQELAASVGASLMVGNNRGAAGDVETTSININGALKASGFHALADVFIRNDDPDVPGGQDTGAMGFQVGASYTLQPTADGHSRWAVGARYSLVSLDDANQVALRGVHGLGAAKGEQTELELMVTNYYRGDHNLKTQVGYRHRTTDPDAGVKTDDDIFEVQFQWVF